MTQYRSLFKHPHAGTVIIEEEVNKTWSLRIENYEGELQGYITQDKAQGSADFCDSEGKHSREYEFGIEWRGAIFIRVGRAGSIVPTYVYNRMSHLLHEQFRNMRRDLFPQPDNDELEEITF